MKEVMNKTVLLILTLIVVACTPQVTITSEVTVTLAPPTQTPIPTPTLHPQFIELQNRIADSGENLTLLPNGQIEENGIAIPNLQVDQNGEISILVEGENIIVDLTDVTFENGLIIEGYTLNENGEWVEAVLTPEQMVMEIFEQNGVDVERFNNETVTVNPSEDGKGFSVTYKETGKVLMENDGTQTKFEIGFVTDEIAAKSCEPTHYRPNANNPAVMEEDGMSLGYYTFDTVTRSGGELQSTDPYFNILINRDLRCWGASEGRHFYYRDKDGVSHEIPLIGLTRKEVIRFMFSRE
jgi:hypothetical protein